MELDNIKELLTKYFDATTSVAEEDALKSYFNGDNVAKELEEYAPMFNYFTEAKKEQFTKRVPLRVKKEYMKWVSVAAVVVFIVSLYFFKPAPTPVTLADEYTVEEIASAHKALALLGKNFNKGTEQLYYLEEFEKTTNKFLIKE